MCDGGAAPPCPPRWPGARGRAARAPPPASPARRDRHPGSVEGGTRDLLRRARVVGFPHHPEPEWGNPQAGPSTAELSSTVPWSISPAIRVVHRLWIGRRGGL